VRADKAPAKRAFAQRFRALAHNVICCTAAFPLLSEVLRTRKRQDEPERGAVRNSGLSPNSLKVGDFHRYNYRMDVAADLDRESSYAFGNRVSPTTGNTSTAWAANYFSIPPLTSNAGTTATTSISYDNNGNVTEVGTTTFYSYDFDNRLTQSNIWITRGGVGVRRAKRQSSKPPAHAMA
jgi:hypothetical protein